MGKIIIIIIIIKQTNKTRDKKLYQSVHNDNFLQYKDKAVKTVGASQEATIERTLTSLPALMNLNIFISLASSYFINLLLLDL